MPGYKGHTFASVIVALLLYGLFYISVKYFNVHIFKVVLDSPLLLGVLLAITVLFSLWPDVDTESLGQNIFYGLFVIVDGFLIIMKLYYPAALLGFFAMLPAVGRHRGWTHSMWACCFFPLLFLILPMISSHRLNLSGMPYFLAAFFGYFSHLLLDNKLKFIK